MNNMIWLMRAAKWVRNPPSPKMVKLVFAIIAAGLAMLAMEKLGMWPDWATMEHGRGTRIPR